MMIRDSAEWRHFPGSFLLAALTTLKPFRPCALFEQECR